VYEDILRYETTQTYPADETKAVKRRLREKSESFTVGENNYVVSQGPQRQTTASGTER